MKSWKLKSLQKKESSRIHSLILGEKRKKSLRVGPSLCHKNATKHFLVSKPTSLYFFSLFFLCIFIAPNNFWFLKEFFFKKIFLYVCQYFPFSIPLKMVCWDIFSREPLVKGRKQEIFGKICTQRKLDFNSLRERMSHSFL